MQRIHKIGGQYIRRMHTDSFFLDSECPEDIEEQIWGYIKEKGLEFTVKGFGKCYFWDINTGFIGNRFVGARVDVIENMRRDGKKMKSQKVNEESLQKHKHFAPNPEQIIENCYNKANQIIEEPVQLTIPNLIY